MGRRQKLIQAAYDLGQALPDWGRPKRPRIRIITAYDDAIATYGDIAAARMRDYAKRHGYDFVVYRDGFDPARPPAWSKILFTLRALRGVDWVVWLDADILIADLDRPLEEFISRDHDIVMARHIKPSPHPNTGVFLLRNRLWVRAFLRHVYAQTGVINHPWWEQVSWNILMEGYRLPRIRVVDARVFNSLHTSKAPEDVYQTGDFLIHFAGLPDKPSLMRDFLVSLSH
ncbi:MAG: DUF273 domain-containing protein [Opitutaceae bacterium]|jgi:hypothetical protein